MLALKMFHVPHNYALLKIDTFILEIGKSTIWKICNVLCMSCISIIIARAE